MAGKRREKTTAFNRANILESAYELFRQKGIAGTTMDDIAKHSDYSKTTIYKYFASKEELAFHLIFEGVESFQTKLQDDAEQSHTFAEFYKRFCASVVEIQTKYPLYYDGIIGANPIDEKNPPSDIHKRIYISGEDINDIIETQLMKAKKTKEITIEDDVSATIIFMRLCIMGIVEKISLKEEYIFYKLGKTKSEFLEFAFNKLFDLFLQFPGDRKKKP